MANDHEPAADASISLLGRGLLVDSGQAMPSSDLSRLAMMAAPDPILVLSADGTVLAASDSVTTVFGWAPSDLIGGSFTEVEPGERARLAVEFAEAVAGGADVVRARVRLRHGDGRLRWSEMSARLLRVDGLVDRVVMLLRDITEQVRAEEDLASAEEHFRLIAENSSDFVLRSDNDGTLQWASPSLERVMGWRPDQVEGTRGIAWVEPEDMPIVERANARLNAGRATSVRVRARRPDGTCVWLASHARPLFDGDRVIAHVSGWRDISHEVAAEAERRRVEDRYRLLAENSLDVVFQTGIDGSIDWASPSTATVLGWPANTLLGRRITEFVHPDDLAQVRSLDNALERPREGSGRVEARFATASGSWRWMSVAGRALYNDSGDLIGAIDALRDVHNERRARDELTFMASHDALTSLLNRSALHREMERVMSASAPDLMVGVLFVDIDKFKPVNDAFGHAIGDDVLVEVAERIVAVVRAGDLIARVGGDELVVVTPGMRSADDAEALANKIQSAFEPELVVGEHRIPISLSIGVSVGRHGDDPDALIELADRAQYRAKRQGRARTEVAAG